MRYEIVQAIENDSRDDPAIFEQAKEYAFGYLDSGPFQRFLKDKLFVNVGPKHAITMLVVGLLLLFAAFMVMLVFILLNQPRTLRLYGAIPLFLGVTALMTSATRFSLWLGLAHHGEGSMFGKFNKYKDTFIRQLHTKRAWKHLLTCLLITVIVGGVFMALPGHRL